MQVAFYFAFTQTYIIALIFPAITGFLAWFCLPQYSLTYAIMTTLWCTIFLEYWKIKELDLSIRWKTQRVGSVKLTRPQFKYEKIIVDDTGRTKHYYPRWKQIARQMLQIPFVLIALITLGALIVLVFTVEVFISEAYNGPYKWYLVSFPFSHARYAWEVSYTPLVTDPYAGIFAHCAPCVHDTLHHQLSRGDRRHDHRV
jgi:anoctamin-10